ncbi:MAG: hypothetical protein HS119_11610 [Flavobacteriales bacterium]|nr:hypothetical protein [Flavobacteriales bacterium]
MTTVFGYNHYSSVAGATTATVFNHLTRSRLNTGINNRIVMVTDKFQATAQLRTYDITAIDNIVPQY